MTSLRNAVVGVLVAAVAILSLVLYFSDRRADREQTERERWETDYNARAPQWRQDSTALVAATDSVRHYMTRLSQAGAYAGALEREAAQLRREREAVIVVPSVPGEAPTIGDTLRACRVELALCEREAAVEKERADSLARVAQDAVFQFTAVRGDLEMIRSAWVLDKALLARAQPIIARAQAPCYVVRKWFVRVNCPPRRDVASWTAAGTLLAVSQFEDDPERRRQQRIGAGVLIGLSFVW